MGMKVGKAVQRLHSNQKLIIDAIKNYSRENKSKESVISQ